MKQILIILTVLVTVFSCKKENSEPSSSNKDVQTVATLTTDSITGITSSSAVSGGYISNSGGISVTQRGVCYSEHGNPTISDFVTKEGVNSSREFVSYLTELKPNTEYFVRAYATNSKGTAYGNEVSFKTTNASGGGLFSPGLGVTMDEYKYKTIVLNNGQEWMAENLRTKVYSTGEAIANVKDASVWSNLTTGAWVNYNNDVQLDNANGKLYNFYAVDDVRNVCPIGWHVPSTSEWNKLITSLGGVTEAGGKMKSTGTQLWKAPNTSATNESGFTANPSGYINYLGTFENLTFSGNWWSSSAVDNSQAPTFYINYNGGNVNIYNFNKRNGLSVRCVKN